MRIRIAAAVVVVSVMAFSRFTAVAQAAGTQPASASNSGAAGAEAGSAPHSSAKPPVFEPVNKPRFTAPPHKFFDARNAFAAGAFALGVAGDSWSTQRALQYPGTREANPLARPFVSSRTGEAIYSGGSLGLLMGGMYLAHRTNHHKVERIVPWALAGWEAFLTGWNLRQISRVR